MSLVDIQEGGIGAIVVVQETITPRVLQAAETRDVTVIRVQYDTSGFTSATNIEQYEVCGRIAAGSGPYVGLGPTEVTTDATPASGDFALGWLSTGELRKFDLAALSQANKVSAPATNTSSGSVGEWAVDSTYFYLCVATNTWWRFVGAINW